MDINVLVTFGIRCTLRLVFNGYVGINTSIVDRSLHWESINPSREK